MFNTKRALTAIALILLMGLLVACNGTTEEEYSPEAQGTPDGSNYPIIINGIGIADNFYTAGGELVPSHVPLFPIADALELVVIQAGSQIAIQLNEISTELEIINYSAGLDGFDISQYDTFMTDDGTVYVPLWVLREFGFEAYFVDGHVVIYAV